MAARARKAAPATSPVALKLPRGYWGPDRVRAILDQTVTTRLEPDLGALAPGERAALTELVDAGVALRDVAEDQEHHQALRARSRLRSLHEQLGGPPETADLLRLYDFSQGPIATSLDNERLPFLPVDGFVPGRNVYPWGITAGEIDAFLERRPDRRRDLLGSHAVVRRTTASALRRDISTLRRQRVLAVLHPGLEERLLALSHASTPDDYYAVPYSVAWPTSLLAVAAALGRAANAIESDDRDLAAYMRLRSRDLLSDDNEAGDAAWVRGQFGHLDVVVGAYEPYDDDLFGAKTFFGMAILLRDELGTREIRDQMRYLQEIDDALPIERHHVLPADIPVGSYDVIAAFGQAHWVGAEILPNDPDLIRKYGRKIALRRNTYSAPERFDRYDRRWRAALVPAQHGDLTPEGIVQQVIWHEIGHHLGPTTDSEGRPHEEQLGEDAALLEELKAELASAFAAMWLERVGALREPHLDAVVASMVLAGLHPVRPLRSQPYESMWLMQLNYFIEHGLIVETDAGLRIERHRRWEVIEAMLREVLALQDRGTRDDSSAFIARYSTWDARHEQLAARIRAVERYRFRQLTYGILEGRA